MNRRQVKKVTPAVATWILSRARAEGYDPEGVKRFCFSTTEICQNLHRSRHKLRISRATAMHVIRNTDPELWRRRKAIRENSRRVLDRPKIMPGDVGGVTPAQIAVRRVARYKNGSEARGRNRRAGAISPLGPVTQQEFLAAKLRKVQKGLPEVVEAFARGVAGDVSGTNELAVIAMSETEALRRRAVDEIGKMGAVVEDDVLGPGGEVIGVKFKAHPLIEHVHKFNDTLGYTAEDHMLTPRSRGDAARDAVRDAILAREARLLLADPAKVPPPPPSDED